MALVMYKPNASVTFIPDRETLNLLLKSNLIDSLIVNSDAEQVAAIGNKYYTSIESLIGFQSALSENYNGYFGADNPVIKNAPMQLFGDVIAATTDYTITGGTASVVTDSRGINCLEVTTNVGASAFITLPKLAASLFDGNAYFTVDATRSNSSGVLNTNGVILQIGNDTSYTSSLSVNYQPTTSPYLHTVEATGPYNFTIDRSRWTTAGGYVGTPPVYPFIPGAARMQINPFASLSAVCRIYSVGFDGKRPKGRVFITCDDGYDSWFSLGLPVFNSRQIPVTHSIISSVQNNNISGSSFLRQLKSAYNAGNSIVAHGPTFGGGVGNLYTAYGYTVPGAPSVAAVASAISDMNQARDFIYKNGILAKDADKVYVWPQGQYQQQTGDSTLLDAAIANGFYVGRCATPNLSLRSNFDALSKHQRLAIPIAGHLWAGTTAAEATNISNIVTFINLCATNGMDLILMFHRVVPDTTSDASMGAAGGISIRVGDLTTIANAIQSNIAAGTQEAKLMNDMASPSSSWASY